MNDTVSFRKGGKGTVFKRTAKSIGLFLLQFRMFGTHMKIECLLLKEPLFAYFADMIEFFKVFFHMIMHRILTLFNDVALGANKFALIVLDILQHGGTRLGAK
jgi:hypothetical protein